MEPQKIFQSSNRNKYKTQDAHDVSERSNLYAKGEELCDFMNCFSFFEKKCQIYIIKNNKFLTTDFLFKTEDHKTNLQISIPLSFSGTYRIWIVDEGRKKWADFYKLINASFHGIHLFYFLTDREEAFYEDYPSLLPNKSDIYYSPKLEKPSDYFR